ncbi:MAG: radical SAM protein, partial [Deltaproteobacteria bacterium]
MMETQRLTRREFLATCGKGLFCLALSASPFALSKAAHTADKTGLQSAWGLVETKLSPYFQSLADNEVQCLLCPRTCVISSGERGYCEVRENRQGKLYSLVYGNPCAVHIDPIEKKPLFHVLPATPSFSIATAGCNFDCKFCQNWEISQEVPEKTL